MAEAEAEEAQARGRAERLISMAAGYEPRWKKELRRVADNDRTLTAVTIIYDDIGESGAAALAAALRKSNSLTVLE